MTVGIVCPGCDAARAPAKRCVADPGPPRTETVPGLQRTTSCCAGPGTRVKDQPAAVRNDGWRNFLVLGLLFTMTFATSTCRAAEGQISYPKMCHPICHPRLGTIRRHPSRHPTLHHPPSYTA